MSQSDRFAYMFRRLLDLSLLADALEFKWSAWVLAEILDEVLWPVKSAFANRQGWLFFGRLFRFFDKLRFPVRQDDFVDQTCRYISTRYLRLYLGLWYDHHSDGSKLPSVDRSSNTAIIVGIMQTRYNALAPLSNVIKPLASLLESEIWLSIESVASVLQQASHSISGNLRSPKGNMDDCLERRFHVDGWCPQKIRCLMTFDPTLVYYASLLGPPESAPHATSCTKFSCSLSVVTEDDYTPKHLSRAGPLCAECTGASHQSLDKSLKRTTWRPNLSRIYDILSKGGIPLITARNSPLCGADLEPSVVECEDVMDYIALSHVWAHGRGNPHANELPLCQLAYIFKKAAEIINPYKLTRIWMDTVCVPAAPVEARKQAILTMREVYRNAYAVLVLDQSFEEAREPCDYLERLVRFNVCDWTTRLWTLQEGRLARSIFIQQGPGAAHQLSTMLANSPTMLNRTRPRCSAV